jgi:N-acylneuraminate cytidylyltransferase
VVTARARKLGVEALQSIDDKGPAVRAWLAERGLAPEHAIFVGNDLNDLPAFEAVGYPVAVADAHRAVRAAAAVVLTRCGGAGAVRELAEMVLSHEA